MSESLALLPALLAPVAALLFLNLRLSRRLTYPHQLLAGDERRSAASMLFRSLRTYYDIFIDAALALVLAFALPSSPSREALAKKSAAVIDCSLSMLAGPYGERPLEAAFKSLLSDPRCAKAEPFALVFDRDRMGTRLVPIRERIEGLGYEGAAYRLYTAFDFFAVDYGALAELRNNGYGEITLFTDRFPGKAEGFRVVESGFRVDFAAYPASARYDAASASWLVRLAEAGSREAIVVSVWDGDAGVFFRAPRNLYRIEDGTGGRLVRFASPGLYRLSERSPPGQLDADIILRLERTAAAVSASGPFSERVLEAFAGIESSPRPLLLLEDRDAEGRPLRGGSGAPARTAETRLVSTMLGAAEGSGLIDPGRSAGRLIAAGADARADFALGPASLANDDLILAYDAIVAQAAPPAFVTAPPRGTASLARFGTSFLAVGPKALVPLNPPASEFFETRSDERIVLPPPSRSRLGWTFALLALAALKIGAWKALSRKPILRRAS
jgi:hypothetical protein